MIHNLGYRLKATKSVPVLIPTHGVSDDGALLPLQIVQHATHEAEPVREFVVHSRRIVGGMPVTRLVQAHKPDT